MWITWEIAKACPRIWNHHNNSRIDCQYGGEVYEVYPAYIWPVWGLHSLWLISVIPYPTCDTGRGLPGKKKKKKGIRSRGWKIYDFLPQE